MTTSLREAVERLQSLNLTADAALPMSFSWVRPDVETLLSALQEAREALVPDGWALVPIEPTEAMISAGANGTRNGARETAARTYASMLSAAEVYRALSPGGADE